MAQCQAYSVCLHLETSLDTVHSLYLIIFWSIAQTLPGPQNGVFILIQHLWFSLQNVLNLGFTDSFQKWSLFKGEMWSLGRKRPVSGLCWYLILLGYFEWSMSAVGPCSEVVSRSDLTVYIHWLYTYCSFSAVIGHIMVSWPPYKSDIGVQYHVPTLWPRAVRFMCSILNFNSWKGIQQKWINTRNSEEFGLLVKSWSGRELVKHIFKLDK